MELREVIGRRRSIRFLRPYQPVEREKIQRMLEAARLASFWGNVQGLKAVVVERDTAPQETVDALLRPRRRLPDPPGTGGDRLVLRQRHGRPAVRPPARAARRRSARGRPDQAGRARGQDNPVLRSDHRRHEGPRRAQRRRLRAGHRPRHPHGLRAGPRHLHAGHPKHRADPREPGPARDLPGAGPPDRGLPRRALGGRRSAATRALRGALLPQRTTASPSPAPTRSSTS